MESEERPTKLRKIQHAAEDLESLIAESATANDDLKDHDSSLADAVLPAEDENTENPKDQTGAVGGESAAPKLSKNQLKKQRRFERWEAGREDRKVKRREKIKAKKERRREEWQKEHENGNGDVAKSADGPRLRSQPSKAYEGTQIPVTVIFDCDFEDLMFDNELKSLGLQLTRSYSDNRKAKYRAHLAFSSFGGKLKERFDGVLAKQYTSWKGCRFFPEDFVDVAEKSKEWMGGSEGGTIAGAISEGAEPDNEDQGEIVYLSSESDNVIERLKPNSTYIIGGLVDKNRHKGVCYKRAMNRGIKTAKLPIGEFLHMKSRQVLTTNHVLEIMLKWMEFGDWGRAFMEVIPKRKGGVLKSELKEGEEAEENDEASTEHSQGEEGDATLEFPAIGEIEGRLSEAAPDSGGGLSGPAAAEGIEDAQVD